MGADGQSIALLVLFLGLLIGAAAIGAANIVVNLVGGYAAG